jgi:hypothetical protein
MSLKHNAMEMDWITQCSFLLIITETHVSVTIILSQSQIFRRHCRQRPHLLYIGLKCTYFLYSKINNCSIVKIILLRTIHQNVDKFRSILIILWVVCKVIILTVQLLVLLYIVY